MKFDELLITTGVDSLVRLVKAKKRVELEIAAQLLNIPVETVEDWARVLEEQGILTIDYRLTKVYLTWATATKEQIAEEKESFAKNKEELMEEIKDLREGIEPDIKHAQELEQTFEKMYIEMKPKLDSLEKKVSTVSKAAAPEYKMDEYINRIEDLEDKMTTIHEAIKGMKDKMTSLDKKGAKPAEMKRHSEIVTKKINELKGFETELQKLKNKISEQHAAAEHLTQQMPSINELRKKHEELKKHFIALRKRTTKIKEDMTNLAEGADVVESVGGSIKEYDKKIGTLKREIGPLTKEADRLETKAAEIHEKLEADKETISRFSDSINVAKGILSRFPTQKKVMEELKGIKNMETKISEKSKALDKLLKMASGGKITKVELQELNRNIDRKMRELRAESQELEKMVENEKATFATYQQIREKISPALQTYKEKVKNLSQELTSIRKDIAVEAKNIEKELVKAKDIVKGKEAKEVLDTVKDIKKKKQIMEEIKFSLESMTEAADKLNKRLKLLSKQAQILQLRAGEDISNVKSAEAAIRKEIKLSKDEEADFRRKRRELRDLIKRLWEES